MHELRNLIHQSADPFANIVPGAAPSDLQGWNSDSPTFARVLGEVALSKPRKPLAVCEVGTWKGASALHMSKILHGLAPGSELVCVDTFLGSLEMWIDPAKRKLMRFANGRAGIYDVFLQNVINTPHMRDIIIPFPTDSVTAAKFFAHHQTHFDLIYVDASHEPEDVRNDILLWRHRANILLGDDYNWRSVREGVEWALTEPVAGKWMDASWNLEVENEKWILRRNPSPSA